MSNVIVVGGGAAGMMAAVFAARNGQNVQLLEKNEKLGKKLFITGKGRCNITNAADIEDLFTAVISNPKFLYSGFYSFTNQQVIDFFEELGVKTKIERGERVFPVSDHSSDVIAAFSRELKSLGVAVSLHTEVRELLCEQDKVCGVLFEAGDKQSETLLKVGNEKAEVSHSDNPICFSDVYFRVGGANYKGKVKNCVTINSNDVIGDNFWVWRADHGDNVGWDMNTAPNGIVINGDNVTMYGLFVEHFQEYQTIWNGNGGKLYFYQSEMPYDAPNQKYYMSHNGKVKGYASFKIDDEVNDFYGCGLGIYCYNRDANIEIFSGAEIPDKDGVEIRNIVTVKLNGQGQITHVINDKGDSVTSSGDTARIQSYENGEKEKY